MGTSRDSFYRIKELYDSGGEAAPLEISRRKPIPKNWVDPHVEEAVVKMAFDFPAMANPEPVMNSEKGGGIFISAASIRCVWQRHNLEVFHKHLSSLEEQMAQVGLILSEAQVIAMERKKRSRRLLEKSRPNIWGTL